MTGYVHSFESLAAVDGEGLRYAVFLAGCPLRCAYCHNPDTHTRAGAWEMDAAALAKKLERYKPYFGDEGGVTFSGGEPLTQAEFLLELMPLLAERGIRYIVDTSGAVPLTETVKAVLAGAQGVILDLKFPDDEGYRRYTGQGIEQPLATLAYLESIGKRTRVRTVVVPGINDSEGAIRRYLPHVIDKRCVYRYELLGFHTLGFFKYEQLGLVNPLADTPPMDREILKGLQAFVDEQMKRA